MKMCDYSKLVFLHFAVQRHMYFNNLICRNYGTFYISDSISDCMWNYFVPENAYLTIKNFDNIHQIICDEYKKKVCIYLPQYIKDYKYIEEVIADEPYCYTSAAKESWLVYDRKIKFNVKNNNIKIEILSSEEHKSDYMNVFVDAYGGEKTDTSPYGELNSEYTETLKDTYKFDNHISFILYYENEPTAVATLCLIGNYGGIYGVGTKRDFRGKGLAKVLMKFLINYYNDRYNKYLFLQTESNSAVEKFYKKLGFKKLFEANFFTSGGSKCE